MPGITGMGTTFNLPNYVGELFAVSPTDTPFLSAIGGLTGGRPAESTIFQWQGYDLRDADPNRARLEGADAPSAEARTRFNVTNVCQIVQEAVETSYTKMAATGQYANTGSNHPYAAGINGSNPVMDEHTWQIQQALKQIARDVEKAFIVNEKVEPNSNSTARKTGGILSAIETNVVNLGGAVLTGATVAASTGNVTKSAHGLSNGTRVALQNVEGAAPLSDTRQYYVVSATTNTFQLAATSGGSAIDITVDGSFDVVPVGSIAEDDVLDLMQLAWENGGISEQDTATLMCGAGIKRHLTKIFITDKRYQEQTRNMGGVSVQTIDTDFGRVNLMLDRFMPADTLAVVSMEQCAPRLLNIPGKGFLFQEELAKTGASNKTQIYGEIGLEWGNEKAHAKMTGIDTSPAGVASAGPVDVLVTNSVDNPVNVDQVGA